jgi:hypothetical protein
MNRHTRLGISAELRAQRDYWTNLDSFQPIQPRHIADRWRPILYPLCILLAALGVLWLLPVEVNVPGTALALGILAALAAFVRFLDRREEQEPPARPLARPRRTRTATTRFPPAYVAETQRLTDEGRQ